VSTLTLPAAVAAILDGAGSQRTLSAVLLNVGPPTSPVLSLAPANAFPAGAGWDASSALVPGLWPPNPRVDGGGDLALPSDQAQGDDPLAALILGSDLGSPVGLRLRHWACDACFADDSWLAEPGEGGLPLAGAAERLGLPLDSAAAALVLTLLAGSWTAERAESERRLRRAMLS
jgi:hypothetical protein